MRNKMETENVKRIIWKMGIPMIISMVLQALYNIVDTAFVINMGEQGADANLALTYAFPIQIMMIAVGVGTGIGINVILSRRLGEKDQKQAAKIAGNGIFLGLGLSLLFLLFGLFGSSRFIALQANENAKAIAMGTDYLTIVATLSFGAIGFAIYERFLQATGKTLYSTIAQIAGAVTNIVLDYVFIYPLNMGVEGAALATVIGQVLSLILAMIFHYTKNKDINGSLKYLRPSWTAIKEIYLIGIPAMIMQAMLSVMMLGVNLILAGAPYDPELLQGTFGIYYKIQQFALFACFGLSNALISIVSFNYGMKDRQRVQDSIRYGLKTTLIIALIIVIIFEVLADYIARLFGLASGESQAAIVEACAYAIRICSLSYIFMGFSVSIQSILQGLRKTISPVLISSLRLIIFVFPTAFLLIQTPDARHLLWWTFPIAEVLTAIIAFSILIKTNKTTVLTIRRDMSN